ncbi:VOC family protein [Hasllibacter sp. MH4015]|uniref:VOC family protein n=1 Tax=Hasllibacter sp. MH4015 TaxID=2854029 RepID=UPI001CD1A683|nr:VOC family protein [Hasllibacter sp. MH4015]
MSDTPHNSVCWVEIAVSDLYASKAFYGAVLQQSLTVDHTGPNPAVFLSFNDNTPGIGGHLYPGKPSREGATIHFVVPDDLDAARARITDAGGQVESPDIAITPGTFFYARDPDGNSIAMFKANG